MQGVNDGKYWDECMGMFEDEESGTQSIYKVRPWRRLVIHVCLFVNDVDDVIVVKQTMNLKRRGWEPRHPAIENVNDWLAVYSCLQSSHYAAGIVVTNLTFLEVTMYINRVSLALVKYKGFSRPSCLSSCLSLSLSILCPDRVLVTRFCLKPLQ